jgi:hypothetical protein
VSAFFRCDTCGRVAQGIYRGDEDRWVPPPEWVSFALEDHQVHGCSREHRDIRRRDRERADADHLERDPAAAAAGAPRGPGGDDVSYPLRLLCAVGLHLREEHVAWAQYGRGEILRCIGCARVRRSPISLDRLRQVLEDQAGEIARRPKKAVPQPRRPELPRLPVQPSPQEEPVPPEGELVFELAEECPFCALADQCDEVCPFCIPGES